MDRGSKRRLAIVAALGATLVAVPAAADVKAGVDAWSKGDYAAAVREWVGPAQEGDPDAQFNLAQAYRLGRGVDADPRQALALYEKAAAQGHLRAADNYGLLLFQNGEREKAMSYIDAAASRGDPRAEYIMGIAHFNGDLAAKDWPRAYALLTLANSAGLPQARAAIQQMDQYIPLADRQAAQSLAAKLKADTDAARTRDMAAVDLALGNEGVSSHSIGTLPTQAVAAPPRPPARDKGTNVAKAAGADFTLPAKGALVVIARGDASIQAPKPAPAPAPVGADSKPSPQSPADSGSGGSWKVRLGAFGVPGNADRMWGQLAGRAELSGKAKVKTVSGKLTMLFAGGYASKADAERACASLKRSGHDCLVAP